MATATGFLAAGSTCAEARLISQPALAKEETTAPTRIRPAVYPRRGVDAAYASR